MNRPVFMRQCLQQFFAFVHFFLLWLFLFSAPVKAALEPGTLQIVARYVTGSPTRHTYMAMGEALAFIEGQDAKIEADQIFYDDRTLVLEARGHVRVTRLGKVTKESSENLKFKADAKEYLLTEPVGQILGPQMVMLAPEEIAR